MGRGWGSKEATTSCVRTGKITTERAVGDSDAVDTAVITDQEEIITKIAVTYEDGRVFQHFGHTEKFRVYDIEDKKTLSSQVMGANGNDYEVLAMFLKSPGVEVLIYGGVEDGARTALAQAGVELYPGVSGDVDRAVEALLSDSPVYDPNTVCSHHHGGGEHGCREHRHSCEEHN